MADYIVRIERALASLVDSVEGFAYDQRPATFDALEKSLAEAKKFLAGTSL